MLVEAEDAVPAAFSKDGVDETVDERIVGDPLVELVEDGCSDDVDVAEFELVANWSVDEEISVADSKRTRLLCSWRSPLLKGSFCCSRGLSAAWLGS